MITISRNINRSIRNHSTSTSSAEYCLDLVKKFDYENFMAVLLLKNTARSSALAVRSFNVEVARVAEQTTQKNTGTARLQFWNETIEKCFNEGIEKIPKHPVAIEIKRALVRSKFTKRYFQNLIKCRQEYILKNHFNSLEEMEKYSEDSVSNVYYLILEGCGIKNVHADHVASHLGKAQGISNLLRGINKTRELNLIPIPHNILIKNKVSEEDILKKRSSEKLRECTFEIASKAHQHLTKARSLIKSVPKKSRPVFLSAVTLDDFLTRLQKVDYDIFSPVMKRKSLFWVPKLMWYNFRNEY